MGRAVARRAGSKPVRYRIVVRGELTASCTRTGPLEGLSVLTKNGYSVITGEIIDQPQIHGILNWLGARGLEIVSLSPAQGFRRRRTNGRLVASLKPQLRLAVASTGDIAGANRSTIPSPGLSEIENRGFEGKTRKESSPCR